MKDYSLKSGERYHTLDTNLVGGDHLWRYRYVAENIIPADRQLFGADIFCGSGYGAALVAEKVCTTILAIDGSAESIATASDKKHDPNIIWAAKLFPFNLPVEAFDYIMCMESMEHVKDHETFFWTLARSLKKGGQLFISCPNEDVMPYGGYKWHYRHFVPAEVRALAEQNGLEEISAFSTTCCGLRDGKVAIFYPHQINNDQPRTLEVGDTMFFEFRKP